MSEVPTGNVERALWLVKGQSPGLGAPKHRMASVEVDSRNLTVLLQEFDELRVAASAVLQALEAAVAYYDQDGKRYRTMSDGLIVQLRAALEDRR